MYIIYYTVFIIHVFIFLYIIYMQSCFYNFFGYIYVLQYFHNIEGGIIWVDNPKEVEHGKRK